MNGYIKKLERMLDAKKRELQFERCKMQRKESEYRLARLDPALGWYGKTQYQKAKLSYEYTKREIKILEDKLQRAMAAAEEEKTCGN